MDFATTKDWKKLYETEKAVKVAIMVLDTSRSGPREVVRHEWLPKANVRMENGTLKIARWLVEQRGIVLM